MAGEYFQLGQIDCLQRVRIPYALGDIKVRMTYPEYSDPRFHGFGLQAPSMPFDIHESLFDSQGMLVDIRRHILNRVGVWQVECPEIRDTFDSAGYCFRRKALEWHVDFGSAVSKDRVLLCNRECKGATGETDITTRQVFLDIASRLDGMNMKTKQCIAKIFQDGSAYSEDVMQFMRTRLNIYSNTGNVAQPALDALAHPDSIIRHFYNPEDPGKPPNIDAYSTLAWDDAMMIHGASNPHGHLISRNL